MDLRTSNGNSKHREVFDREKIEFPISFELKAVMLGTENDDDNKEKLVNVFQNHEIDYKYHNKKLSSKGAYVSYTFEVTLNNKLQMDSMYEDLKKIKELKFAV